ncbi:MAG: hypothetical protein KOO60_12965 [Gemmatimonadales bacterium]|nr:hypothetical protein [Gemmatimonadales bacterium]
MYSVRFCSAWLLLVVAAILTAGPLLAQSTTATGLSRDFNPAISINALLACRLADQTTDRAYNGVNLQEAEMQVTSIVDPYWKANLVFAVHPAHSHDDAHAHGFVGDVEVATVTGLAIGGGFGLVLGKDYLPFGKHAALHTHQFPFVDAPAVVGTFLGGHSLSETGLRLSHELPLTWYSDLTGYAVDGKSAIFNGESRDPVFGARFSNVVDLGMESTLEFSGSMLHGKMAPNYLLLHDHEELGGSLDVYGADLTFKWISAQASKGPALTLTGEVILPRPESGPENPLGWYALAQYRFARNWWLGVTTGGLDRDLPEHTEHVEPEEEGHAHGPFEWAEVFEYKANLTWAPSEFSSVRFEVARYEDPNSDHNETLVSLQVNFTIGSHPAHLY